jgi:predicted DNA-binding protein (UPF0251 family)/predicted Fe-Mo cluster-binding NifX family protein
MARQKCRRHTSYQPLCTRFTPKDATHNESVSLLAEEMEALYLMDLLGLYQEEAAEKMEVSRPTFARIIKSARHKVALALLGGHHLTLESKRERFVVAFCCDSLETLTPLQPKGKYLVIATVQDHKIVSWTELENPAAAQNAKPPLVLPDLFQAYHVNFFLTDRLGEGLRNTLALRGIHIVHQSLITKEMLTHLFDS